MKYLTDDNGNYSGLQSAESSRNHTRSYSSTALEKLKLYQTDNNNVSTMIYIRLTKDENLSKSLKPYLVEI